MRYAVASIIMKEKRLLIVDTILYLLVILLALREGDPFSYRTSACIQPPQPPNSSILTDGFRKWQNIPSLHPIYCILNAEGNE